MGKSHFWLSSYDRNGDRIKIIVEDFSGRKIEDWTINIRDSKTSSQVMKILKDKYGFSPEIPKDESVNTNKKDKDLSWLKDDTNPF